MQIAKGLLFSILGAIGCSPVLVAQVAESGTAAVAAQWSKIEGISPTVPTTQVLAHAFTPRSHPLHDPIFRAVGNLHTDSTRLQLWFSVTNLALPEIKEPTATETFWDFRYMDDLVADYYAQTSGRHHLNMGTIPRWMFKVPPVDVPSDPGASFYAYTDGTRGDLLKDPTGKQFAEYQVRLYQWYTQGGFTDEIGKYHKSGHYYKVDYWGVLNEPDFENHITVEQYTEIYDAVTTAIHKIDPQVQFFGPEVSGAEVQWAKYFLDPRNHNPAAPPVEWFAFHNYVNAPNDPATWHAKYFTDPESGPTDGVSARAFAERIRQVMQIRDELSPKTELIVDELGTFNIVKPEEEACRANEPYSAFHPLYWNANGANWAFNFITAENLGLPLMSVSQMVGYPTQCPSIAMFDPESAKPNAHYWVLYLINRHFGPGDRLAATTSSSEDVMAQASVTPGGRKLLLINTTHQPINVDLSGAFEVPDLSADIVDQDSGEGEPRHESVKEQHLKLAPFAVAVVVQE